MKKMKSYSRTIFLLASLVMSIGVNVFLVNTYEVHLSNFNAKLANLLRGNDFSIRDFDERGLPLSNFSRIKKHTISPFYVVHYGLIYSDSIPHPEQYRYLWDYDSSTQEWNVPPPKRLITRQNFLNSANWVVENVSVDKFGSGHLFYNFDWPYKQLKTGGLKAPWYSGLTDAHALTLLLRAYVVTSDSRYLDTAKLLYDSTVKHVSKGGSLIYLQDNAAPWIEEYVDTRLPDFEQSRVLNGMVYSTLGIMNFERFTSMPAPLYPSLLLSIKNNLHKFDAQSWTFYDMIGTKANIKYHKIHVALMHDLYEITQDKTFYVQEAKWSKYREDFFTRNFLNDKPTPNDLMVLICFLISSVALTAFIFTLSCWVMSKIRHD